MSVIINEREWSRLYREALQSGQVTIRNQRLLLVGQGRAGKTSLYKALVGGQFDPEEETTEVFDVNSVNLEGWKPVCTVVDGDDDDDDRRHNKGGMTCASCISHVVTD